MKRIYYFACVFVCIISLFASGCNSDGKEVGGNEWELLPSGQIEAEKVSIDLNGEPTTGSVTFKALNATSAQLELKNVVDGYGEIDLDVKMLEQTDGSFTLSAVKAIESKPSTRAAAAMLDVRMDGSVTAAGHFSLTLSAEGPGLFIGTYKGDNLVLTYSGEKLAGYEVVFDGTKGDDVTIALKDIVPGENETVLENIEYKNGAFSGKADTDYAAIEFAGSRADKVLTLDLKVKMNDPSNWVGTYGMSEYTLGHWEMLGISTELWSERGAIYSNWIPQAGSEEDAFATTEMIAGLIRGFGGIVLPQVLQTLSIHADGNIVANYVETPTIHFNMEWLGPVLNELAFPTQAQLGETWIPTTGWATSPKHLAKWYEKEGHLYLKLDIKNIIAAAAPENADMADVILQMLATSTPASIKELVASLGIDMSNITDATIEQLLGWVKNGIPMVVEKKEGARTCISLDKTAFDNLFTTHQGVDGGDITDIIVIWDAAVAAGIIPEEAALAGSFLNLFPYYWSVTSNFNLGLDMQKK